MSPAPYSPALDVAGLALATSMLIHGLAVSDHQAVFIVGACMVVVLFVIARTFLRNPESDRRRWLAPRELHRAVRRYASQSRWQRLRVGFGTLLFLVAILRFIVLLGEREWARAVAEVPLMIFWVAIAEHFCADTEPAATPSADGD